jgi:hypothetical protein
MTPVARATPFRRGRLVSQVYWRSTTSRLARRRAAHPGLMKMARQQTLIGLSRTTHPSDRPRGLVCIKGVRRAQLQDVLGSGAGGQHATAAGGRTHARAAGDNDPVSIPPRQEGRVTWPVDKMVFNADRGPTLGMGSRALRRRPRENRSGDLSANAQCGSTLSMTRTRWASIAAMNNPGPSRSRR